MTEGDGSFLRGRGVLAGVHVTRLLCHQNLRLRTNKNAPKSGNSQFRRYLQPTMRSALRPRSNPSRRGRRRALNTTTLMISSTTWWRLQTVTSTPARQPTLRVDVCEDQLDDDSACQQLTEEVSLQWERVHQQQYCRRVLGALLAECAVIQTARIDLTAVRFSPHPVQTSLRVKRQWSSMAITVACPLTGIEYHCGSETTFKVSPRQKTEMLCCCIAISPIWANSCIQFFLTGKEQRISNISFHATSAEDDGL